MEYTCKRVNTAIDRIAQWIYHSIDTFNCAADRRIVSQPLESGELNGSDSLLERSPVNLQVELV